MYRSYSQTQEWFQMANPRVAQVPWLRENHHLPPRMGSFCLARIDAVNVQD